MPGRPPPLSVLLPVRDAAATLPEAIASLEAQTFGDFEVLAVDDGSSDASGDILQAWAERDRRVRALRGGGKGLVQALELARAEARGAFLARMDADDVALPRRFEAQVAALRAREGLVALGTRVEYFPASRVREGARRYAAWLNAAVSPREVEREIFVECPIAHPAAVFRAAAVEAVGGYRDPGWPEDYDLVFRLWRAGGRLSNLPEVLLRWREGPDRLSRTDPRYAPGAFRRCKVHHLVRAYPHIARVGVVIWGAGPVGKRLSRALETVGVRRVAFAEVDPRKIGQEIHGAPVLHTARALALRAPLHLAAVGQPGARERLRAMLTEGGFQEMKSFVCMA